MELRFTVRFRSDYHIGAGHGSGSEVDSALFRDTDEVPVLRGSTIEGLMRDGLWRLLQTGQIDPSQLCKASGHTGTDAPLYCDKSGRQCLICLVFGTPQQRKRWRFSSTQPAAGRPAPMTDWQLGRTDAQVIARVRVNPRLRRAEARKLFKQEEGDKRLNFTFSITSASSDAQAHHEAALLVAAARFVRRLGSARRRGRGECLLRLDTVTGWHSPVADHWQEHILGHFEKRWLGIGNVDVSVADPKWERPAPNPRPAESPKRFRLLIKTNEPVVLARRAEAGNIFDSNDYISGSAFMGALAQEAASRWDLSDQDIYTHFVRLFKRGALRFSPLYPAHESLNNAFQTIPVPFDCLACKARADHRRLRSYATVSELPDVCEICSNNDASVGLTRLDGYLAVRAGADPHNVRQREEMHPEIDPNTQRVATGNLFGYVGVASGQYFIGEIWCQDEGTWDALGKLTGIVKTGQFSLRLGKAMGRGYGLVTAWLEEIANGRVDAWRGVSLSQRVTDGSSVITMTLLTDAIIPDPWGRFRQTLDGGFLKEQIGERFTAGHVHAFCKAGYVDGFNHHLGLPRWRDIALKAGSAVGIRLKAPPADAIANKEWWDDLRRQLQTIEDEGLGLRRNEGFGWVAFNHPVYSDGAGINNAETAFHIDESFRSGAMDAVTDHQELTNWTEQLREEFKHTYFRKETIATNEEEANWMAVARWLHGAAEHPIADPTDGETIAGGLNSLLQQFGSERLLTDVKREKEGFFMRKSGAEGIDYLVSLLGEVATREVSAEARRKMLQLLAERLAYTVKKGEI